MKNKTYLKASLREIRQSKGRFIAITLIIFLGTFLFVGVKSTGPILNHSASEYVNGQQLADLQVTSTLGLTKDDIDAAEKAVLTQKPPINFITLPIQMKSCK